MNYTYASVTLEIITKKKQTNSQLKNYKPNKIKQKFLFTIYPTIIRFHFFYNPSKENCAINLIF